MNVCVIGTGYVGLVTGAGLAETGNQVVCVDIDVTRIENLKRLQLPFFEPKLQELVDRNVSNGRLRFSSQSPASVRESDVCFIAVGTPPTSDGQADISTVLAVGGEIALNLDNHKVIAVKSTVPVGTCALLTERLQSITDQSFSIASNPEFLKQGSAVDDFLRPDRIVIGTNDTYGEGILRELYSPFVSREESLVSMDVASAEMTKYVANCFLATKISFVNEIANLCEVLGADIEAVRAGVGSDPRIGPHFLHPGIGYGGSCFPKDMKALIQSAEDKDIDLRILRAAAKVNEAQAQLFVNKVKTLLGSLRGKSIAAWGLSFKPNTDDMREAPSLKILASLLSDGASIKAYDPKAGQNASKLLDKNVNLTSDPYACLENADALIVLTEWDEFRTPDLQRMRQLMRRPLVLDGRSVFDAQQLAGFGFTCIQIGRQTPTPEQNPSRNRIHRYPIGRETSA